MYMIQKTYKPFSPPSRRGRKFFTVPCTWVGENVVITSNNDHTEITYRTTAMGYVVREDCTVVAPAWAEGSWTREDTQDKRGWMLVFRKVKDDKEPKSADGLYKQVIGK